ncbi:hypothetical protein MOKP58_43680 [Mycobacterium avium subsp. hominissuis]
MIETALGRSDCPSANSSSHSDFGQDEPAIPEGLQLCYVCSMSEVASRELRNDTAGVLRRVREGEDVTITVNGRAVAMLTALGPQRRRWLSKAELLSRLRRAQADPGLRQDLATLAGDTTEDLGPIR